MYHLTGQVGATSTTAVLRSDNDSIAGGAPLSIINFADAMQKENCPINNKFDFNNQRSVASQLLVRPRGNDFRIDDIKDGQGNQVLFSENLQAIQWNQLYPDRDNVAQSLVLLIAGLATVAGNVQVDYPQYSQLTQGFVWHYRDAKGKTFNGSTSASDVMHINGQLNGQDKFIASMTAANAHEYARPSSAHADGVNMGFADGSSKFVTQSIDYRAYQGLMTPRGKSSDVPFRQYVTQGEQL